MNEGSRTFPPLVMAFATASFLAASCGPAVNPDEVCPAPATVCWNTAGMPLLAVNDVPVEAKALPDEADGFLLTTRVGIDYSVVVRLTSGRVQYYIAPGERVDVGSNTIASGRNPGAFTFTATQTRYSVVVQDQGGPTGSEYTLRVYSYDEPSEPLPGTIYLEVNGAAAAGKLVKNGLARFAFPVELGRDYTVSVDTTNGSVSTYMSTISSVDQDVHEWVATFGSIRFRARRTGWMYVAAQDRAHDAGSDFLLAVTDT